VSPYPLIQLTLTAYERSGKAHHSKTTLDGQARPVFRDSPADLDVSAFIVRASFGTIGPDLTYVPPVDVLPVLGQNLTIDVWFAGDPRVARRFEVPPRYECAQFVNFSGRTKTSPVVPGGGEEGPHVKISLGTIDGPGGLPLTLVRIDDLFGLRARTVFGPAAPPLQVFVDGGPGGDGGSASIYYDVESPELERKVIVYNRGFIGGRDGPLPRTHPERASALFSDEIRHGIKVRHTSAESDEATKI
jgi:hypothetical protein